MEKRSSIIGGLILIFVGALFLILQLFPGLSEKIDLAQHWPLLIVALGVFFLLGALLGTPPLAVPGSIISGIGGMMYVQNLTGNWASWAYSWTLIPGFVGIGIILMHFISGRLNRGFREGGPLLVISALMFIVFALFFNVGGLGGLGRYWPIFLILAGGWLLIKRK